MKKPWNGHRDGTEDRSLPECGSIVESLRLHVARVIFFGHQYGLLHPLREDSLVREARHLAMVNRPSPWADAQFDSMEESRKFILCRRDGLDLRCLGMALLEVYHVGTFLF